MRYLSFTIEQYRGITEPLTINLRRESLVPIVGINECGKTTILEALLAFDHYNDDKNEGKQLKNLQNLFAYSDAAPRVSALIEISEDPWEGLVDDMNPELNEDQLALLQKIADNPNADVASLLKVELSLSNPESDEERKAFEHLQAKQEILRGIDAFRQLSSLPGELLVIRHLKNRYYNVSGEGVPRGPNFRNALGRSILKQLPYIFYFDDFRHDVPKEIELDEEDPSEWADILETLFRRASNKEVSVFQLKTMEARRRKSAVALARKYLNETLTKQWQQFNLENADALSIDLNFHEGNDDSAGSISFDVVEIDERGQQHFFTIKDRSKGFFWFFNFVMRLEFNPKAVSGDEDVGALYLLDEPGSYLHASAQSRLCKKLKELAVTTPVIYCTHSHHLLEPDIIPFINILIVSKRPGGTISATPITEYRQEGQTQRLAFQPIYEALQFAPSSYDFHTGKVLVTEGMYDFFAYSLFFGNGGVQVVPAVGAGSMRYVVSLLIATGANYRVLWDNDAQGQKNRRSTEEIFGIEEATRRFKLLPIPTDTKARKRILQDLFDGSDLATWRLAMGLPSNSSFKKVLISVFYADMRDNLINNVSDRTRKNFHI